MTTKSSGIMLASQVCERLVLPRRQEPTDTRHYRQASNYFHRPPVNTARRSPEAIAASAAFAREGYASVPLAETVPPAPPAHLFEPEPEPEPAPRIEVPIEVITSWGSWSRAELYEQATELSIRGRSSMTKRMLLKALVAYVRGD